MLAPVKQTHIRRGVNRGIATLFNPCLHSYAHLEVAYRSKSQRGPPWDLNEPINPRANNHSIKNGGAMIKARGGHSAPLSVQNTHGRMWWNVQWRSCFMINLRSLYLERKRKTAENMSEGYSPPPPQHITASKGIFFFFWWWGWGGLWDKFLHPEGADSSLFVVIYLSMIFLCLKVCFIILFTYVPLTAPRLSPTNVTHGFICSVLLCAPVPPLSYSLCLAQHGKSAHSYSQVLFPLILPIKSTRSGSELSGILHLFQPLHHSVSRLFCCGPLLQAVWH